MPNKITLPDKKIEEFKKYYSNNTIEWCSRKYNVNMTTITFWARKLKLKRKNNKKIDINESYFNDIQYEIIIGTLLGDASLSKIYKKSYNSNYKCGHGIVQYEYLKDTYEKLKPFSSKIISSHGNKIIEIKNNKIINSKSNKINRCDLWTIRHPLFTELERKWYKRDENGEYVLKQVGKNGKMTRIKIIPRDIELTPRILAYWHFDDGCLNIHKKSILLSTLSFTIDECEFLIEKLKNNLNFNHPKLILKYNNEKYPQIYISRKDMYHFIDIIKEYNTYDCLKHKTNISKIKKPWYMIPGSPPPKSNINKEMTNKIIDLTKKKIQYKEIAKKLNLTKGSVERVIRGKSAYNKIDFGYNKTKEKL